VATSPSRYETCSRLTGRQSEACKFWVRSMPARRHLCMPWRGWRRFCGCAGVPQVAPRPRSVHAHSGRHRACGGRRHHAGKRDCLTEHIKQSCAMYLSLVDAQASHNQWHAARLACSTCKQPPCALGKVPGPLMVGDDVWHLRISELLSCVPQGDQLCCCLQVLAGLALAMGMGSYNPRVRLRW